MKIRVCNLGITSFPEKIEGLGNTLIAKLDENGFVEQTGFMTMNHFPEFQQPKLFQESITNLLNYQVNGTRLLFYMGQKIITKSSTTSVFHDLFGIDKKEFRWKVPASTCFFTLISSKNYDLTAICSLSGNPSKETFDDVAGSIQKAINSQFIPAFIKLSSNEIIDFASNFMEEGHRVVQTKTDLSEGEIGLSHPDDIFEDPDIQQIDDIIGLRGKIDRGDWKYLRINVPDKYLISLSKLGTDFVTLQLFQINAHQLIEACEDILKRIYRVKGKNIIRTSDLRVILAKESKGKG